jgi:glycosyltransferase involved in cell wall biosynthesis
MSMPLVTIAVPSFNQGRYLEDALSSIFNQNLPVEVFLLDGGSSDNSMETIQKWVPKLSGWRSEKDEGQASAINEGIALGTAPFVCWLNSDDWFMENGLRNLLEALEARPECAAVYGRAQNFVQETGKQTPVWVEPFDLKRLAKRCIISQPATLIRRSAWEQVKGVDVNLHMALDYDLWWRLAKTCGPLHFLPEFVAVNREHAETKTKTKRRWHYKEAMQVVKKHNGTVPLKWWIAQPYAVWYKSFRG